MDFIARKEGRQLTLAPDQAEKLGRHVKDGDDVLVAVKVGRNTKLHAKYWVLCAALGAGLGISKQETSDMIKLMTGHVRVVKYGDRILTIPKSISLATMDGQAFEEFYEAVLDAAALYLDQVNNRDTIEEIILGKEYR